MWAELTDGEHIVAVAVYHHSDTADFDALRLPVQRGQRQYRRPRVDRQSRT
jgi:hypothetical protein